MKKLLATARKEYPEESLLEIDHAGVNAVLDEVLLMWSNGEFYPENGTFIEKTIVSDRSGETLGFNYYLVSGEPQHLGKPRTEITD